MGFLILNGPISGASQNLTFDGVGNAISYGAINTGTGGLSKNGTGIVGLYGANSYTGVTTVNAGTLQLASGTAIADTGAVFIIAAGTLEIFGSETIGSLAGIGQVDLVGGGGVFTVGGANTNFSGVIFELGGVGSLTKIGTGTQTLSGANTYTGTTTITGGTLKAGTINTFSAASAVVDNATLDLGGFNQTIKSISGSVNLTGHSLNVTAQAGGIGALGFNGAAGIDALSITLDASTITLNLAANAFTNWTDGTDTITVTGNALANSLTGSSHNDILNGLDGTDLLIGGLGADILNGGLGNDTASYAGYASGIAANLLTGLGADGDTFIAIENLTGSSFGDVLIGNAGANSLDGGAGNDVLIGNGGGDTLNGGADTDTVDYAGYAAGVNINLLTGIGTLGELLISIENINGSCFGDVLTGDAGANAINGGAGNDFLVAGNGADNLNGGADLDTVSYATATGGVFVNLGTGVGANGGVLVNIENILGSAFGDVLYGDAGSNTINGGAGNDFLVAGNGADNLIGGADLDTVSYETATLGIFANLQTGIGANGGVLSQIENLTGSAFGDVLYGDAGSNTIKGGAGNDYIVGGAGSDALYGGADADQFRFEAAGYGNDVIVDYQDGLDRLSFATSIATNFSAFTISGNDTMNVTLTLAGQILTIQGTANIHIDASDFIFV